MFTKSGRPLNAKTGTLSWKHDMLAAVLCSPMVADGKVYLGDEDGAVTVFAEGKTKKLLSESNMGAAVSATVHLKGGVLYTLGRNRVFAIKEPKYRRKGRLGRLGRAGRHSYPHRPAPRPHCRRR